MLKPEQENLRQDEAALRRELESAGVQFRGRTCRCPFHDDRTPSAGIYLSDGVWRFKCHGCQAGGDIFDIRALLNKRTPGEELQAVRNPNPKPLVPIKIFPTMSAIASIFRSVEAVYEYRDPDTDRLDMAVIRFKGDDGDKGFIQCSPRGTGFAMRGPEGLLPIYNRKAIRGVDTVVVVEGEKCVEALASIGIVATTSPGGALKSDLADWSPLAGKTVILWPDNDPFKPAEPEFLDGRGVEHMRRVSKALQMICPAMMWINPKELELPPKGDVADIIERYRANFTKEETKALVEDILADAERIGIAGEYQAEIEETIKGNRRTIRFPWDNVTAYSRALMRGKVLCVCGDGGCGKSLLMSDCLVDWHQCIGTKACVYHLEDDRNYHLRRVHAQLAGNAKITDNDWIEANGDHMRSLIKIHAMDLEEIGKSIWEAPDDQVSLDMLATWVEARAKSGFEIIMIDPITAAASENRPWIADLKFITKIKMIARQYRSVIILITHPRSGTSSKRSKADHNDMAGGAAYPRFAHSVFWLERNDGEAVHLVRLGTDPYPTELVPNRILYIAKARNGPGAGRRIAFRFDPETLRFKELGPIEKASL